MSVPDDVAVVGIDDVDEAAVNTPALATVAIDFQRVGMTAFEVALRGGRGGPVHDRYLVSQCFVPRQSCGCLGSAGGPAGGGGQSAVAAFTAALTEAAREGGLDDGVDPAQVELATRQVVEVLSAPAAASRGPGRPAVAALAARITGLCRVDRSVQSAVRAIHVLAQALADADPPAAGHVMTWSVAADLCDAVRAGQLQRRMSEYVDLKRLQVSHYFVANSLLGHDRDELRSLTWLQRSPAQVGALGLWSPAGQTERIRIEGCYDRAAEVNGGGLGGDEQPVESFPPAPMLHDADGRGRLVVVTQVSLEDSDWGLLAVGGGGVMQSSLVQETFQQWSIQMAASLDQEQANAELARKTEELHAAYEEVRLSEERYALAAEASRDALWDWDIATGTVFYSSSWKALLGYVSAQVGTSPDEWLLRVHPEDCPGTLEQVRSALDGDRQFLEDEHRIQVAGGEYRWFACRGRSVLDEQGRPVRLVGSITDVTARRLLQEQLLYEARFDTLTGLVRTGPFKERLGAAFEQARQRPDRPFAVLFADLNGFKEVNDSLGHAAGDELLAIVAERLSRSLREHDVAARLGGDEFAVILSDVVEDELPAAVDRITALIRDPYQLGDRTAYVGVAVGVAVSTDDYADAEDMLRDADSAMYRAKRRNKQSNARMTTLSSRTVERARGVYAGAPDRAHRTLP